MRGIFPACWEIAEPWMTIDQATPPPSNWMTSRRFIELIFEACRTRPSNADKFVEIEALCKSEGNVGLGSGRDLTRVKLKVCFRGVDAESCRAAFGHPQTCR